MVRKTKYKWNFPPSPFYEVLNFGHFEQKHEFSESIYKTVFLPSILFCVVSGSKVFIYLQNIELILKICIFFFSSFVLFQGCFEFCKKKKNGGKMNLRNQFSIKLFPLQTFSFMWYLFYDLYLFTKHWIAETMYFFQ